jgi:glycosyltransferase involved in cell wall biosynthesis
MKNEAGTLPKLALSLKDFLVNGGVWVCTDTGSTDDSANVARSLGAIVYEEGEKFIKVITKVKADKINKRFLVPGEPIIVREGDRLFDFASARNYCADKAPTNMVIAVDGDEFFTKLDFNKINEFIDSGIEMFETEFIFARTEYGEPAIQFVQNRFYDKRVMQYSGIVHEIPVGNTNRIKRLPTHIYMLEHGQELGKIHRSSYLTGLALDCYEHRDKDRQSHYFARELLYSGRYKSAIAEFKRHLTLGGWVLEAAQSMIFIGDCYGRLNMPEEQIEWYNRSIYFNSDRREAFIRMAEFYRHNQNIKACAAYAAAALVIPYTDYYANNMDHYRQYPHELLYWACGWIGNIKEAQDHIIECLKYQPDNLVYLRDTQYYFEYPAQSIEGWISFLECQWLYNTAKKMNSILEIGSWEGKSSHALLSGCKGKVTCVDHFQGSSDPSDLSYIIAKKKDIYTSFIKNVGHFKNLEVIRASSEEASEILKGRKFDMIFIDGTHTYDEVKKDINLWQNRTNILLTGHDYGFKNLGVKPAVDELLGIPDEIVGSIWAVNVSKRTSNTSPSPVTQNIPKKIFTIWLNKEKELPPLIQKCINSQKLEGYEHKLITLDNCFKDSNYIQSFLSLSDDQKIWTKATDYLRIYYLYTEGGIYLDADVEVLQAKTFDHLLNARMFVARETNGYLGSAVIGAEKGYPFLKQWLDAMTTEFKGDDNKYFEPSMELLTVGYHERNWYKEGFVILSYDYFFPYDHLNNTVNITDNTIAYHYFAKGWKEDDSPTVSIIIPTLGREQGLQNCLNSIKYLNYPQDKIETIVIEDKPRLGVPLRIKEGYEKSMGEYICYAANDMEFTPNSLRLAIKDSIKYNKRLVAFDTGVRNEQDYICEHFVIKRSLVEQLGGIFDTRFKHYCCDTLLWEKAFKLNETMISKGFVNHYHYSRIGSGMPIDNINELAIVSVDEDRTLLTELRSEKTDIIKFKRERKINRLALPITRGCNRRCPECTAVEREGFLANPISIVELKEVGNLIGSIEKIEVTGGEPSFHPKFKEISENLHKWFQCKDIMLLTNGWAFSKDDNLPILLNYDRVYITHYNDNFAKLYEEKSNTHLVKKLESYLKNYPKIQFWPQDMDSHNPIKEPVPWASGCLYDYDKSDMISYHEGQLYGCCTAWQLDYRGKGIPLTKEWRDHLSEIELPCNKCFLGIEVKKLI